MVASFLLHKFPKIRTKWAQNFLKSESRGVGIGGKGVIASFLSVPLFMVRVIIFFAKVISLCCWHYLRHISLQQAFVLRVGYLGQR